MLEIMPNVMTDNVNKKISALSSDDTFNTEVSETMQKKICK